MYDCCRVRTMFSPSLPSLPSRRQVLNAGLMAALGSWAALELFETEAGASTTPGAATRVSMVGDSLTTGVLPYQADAFSDVGWARSAIDAYRTRGVRTKAKADPRTGLTAVDAIRSTAGDSDVWIVALGTNDAGIQAVHEYPTLIGQMMDRIGPGHRVVWVNIYLPATPPRQRAWNTALTRVADERADEMIVYDWATLASQNAQWLSLDQVHYTGSGYRHRAKAVADATRSLVPAVLNPIRARRPG
jgi:lysophospholipase L1-like esterase